MFEAITNKISTEFNIPAARLVSETGMYWDEWGKAWCCKLSYQEGAKKRFFLGERFLNNNIYVTEILALNRNS